MTKYKISLFFMFTAVLCEWAHATGTRTGNGGSFVAQDFSGHVDSAWELIQQMPDHGLTPEELKDLGERIPKLKVHSQKSVEVVDKDNPELSIEKDAVNYPDLNRIDANENVWPQKSTAERLGIVAHELYGLIKKEIDTYYYSNRFKNYVNERIAKASTTPEALPLENPNQFVFEKHRDGLSLDEAQKNCQAIQQQYGRIYFHIYCEFKKKIWTSKETVTWREHIYPPAHYHVNPRKWYPFGYPPSTFHQPKPWVSVTEKTYDRSDSVYDLKVFGLGRYTTLFWKKLYSSLEAAGGTLVITKARELEAKLLCREQQQEFMERDLARYIRSECVVFPHPETNTYSYEIRTQNPYVVIE